jgi:hypothetical protein
MCLEAAVTGAPCGDRLTVRLPGAKA